MNLKEIHTLIGNKWIEITGISDELKNALQRFEGNNVVGFVYVDHFAGITLDVVKVFDIIDGAMVSKVSPENEKTRVICRIKGILNSEHFHILEDSKVLDLGLEVPEYLSVYERPDLKDFRDTENFHPFRAEGYPDDIQVVLLTDGNFQPELIWARVEKYEDEVLRCQLLNKPHQNLGLNKNDWVNATLKSIEGETVIFAVPDQTQLAAKSGKPWYKFW